MDYPKHNHGDLPERVKKQMPEEELLAKLAGFYRTFGDLTRMKILYALSKSEMCVCALAEMLGMPQPAISHQLKVLRDADLVGCRREGKAVCYFLADSHVMTIIANGFEHITEERGAENELS